MITNVREALAFAAAQPRAVVRRFVEYGVRAALSAVSMGEVELVPGETYDVLILAQLFANHARTVATRDATSQGHPLQRKFFIVLTKKRGTLHLSAPGADRPHIRRLFTAALKRVAVNQCILNGSKPLPLWPTSEDGDTTHQRRDSSDSRDSAASRSRRVLMARVAAWSAR